MSKHANAISSSVSDASSGTICSVCQEEIGTVRPDGSIEIQYSLPCSHIFGNICILRWLQDSPRQDCPHCRRTMIHSGCGHLIMPHNSTTAPLGIPESETPNDCLRCRGEGTVATALKYEQERLQAQEAALRGMQVHLPRVFGGFAPKSVGVGGVDERIMELRKAFALLHERAFSETERRERW